MAIKGVTPGMTDSRYYSNLTKNIYKFLPMKINNSELKRQVLLHCLAKQNLF